MDYTGISMIDFKPEMLIRKIESGLPGEKAQKKMAPSVRLDTAIRHDPNNSKDSSILIPLFPYNDSWGTVLIERTQVGPHGGQISFPGGKRDPGDLHALDTALREAEEEVGLDRESVSVLGQLSDLYVPNSNFWISPFIGLVANLPEWKLNPAEVEKIILVELNALFDFKTKKRRVFFKNGIAIDAPYYDVEGHFVWGATAMIISELEDLVR